MFRQLAIVPNLMSELDDIRSIFKDCSVEKCGETPKARLSDLTIYETENQVFVEAPASGIPSKDIQVTFEKGVLSIQGEAQEEQKEEEAKIKYHTKAKRALSYRIQLPFAIDENATPQAICKDGLLKVSFQKSRVGKPHRIEVHAA